MHVSWLKDKRCNCFHNGYRDKKYIVYGTTFVATSPGKDFGCCFEGKDLRFWLLWYNYIDCSSLIFYARIQVEWKRFNPFPFQIVVFQVALICLSLCICAPLRVYSHKWLHHKIVTIVLYIEFCSPNKIYGNVQGLGSLDYGKLQVEALKVKIWTMMGMDMTFHCKLWCFRASSTLNYFLSLIVVWITSLFTACYVSRSF